jgi:hypothetical protein
MEWLYEEALRDADGFWEMVYKDKKYAISGNGSRAALSLL